MATNALGSSSDSAPSGAVTLSAVPDPPTDLTATSGSSQVTLSWNPGASNGSRITSFTASVVGSNTLKCTYTVPLSGTPTDQCTITGLTNGTSYTFQVVATSAIGTSSASATTTAMAVPLPGAPTGVSLTARNGAIDASWSMPNTAANYVIGYRASTETT